MEFLYKLYESEYFGIGLFIVITILTFLFLVILFFGKKDEKVRKLEETKKLELENETAFKQTNDNIEDLSIPVIEQPQEEVVVQEQKNTDTPLVEEPKEEVSNLTGVDLAAFNQEVEKSLNEPTGLENPTTVEEIPTISNPKMEEMQQPVEDVDINNLFQTNIEPIQEENTVQQEKVLDIEEAKPEMELPKTEAPFSSVYVNKEETIVPPVQEVHEEEKQGFELPKMAEMPKLNEETNIQKEEPKVEEKVENKEETPISDFDSLFGSIEKETFDIEK